MLKILLRACSILSLFIIMIILHWVVGVERTGWWYMRFLVSLTMYFLNTLPVLRPSRFNVLFGFVVHSNNLLYTQMFLLDSLTKIVDFIGIIHHHLNYRVLFTFVLYCIVTVIYLNIHLLCCQSLFFFRVLNHFFLKRCMLL